MKRFFTVIVAAALTASLLAACGRKTETTPSAEPVPTETETAAEESTTEEESSSAGQTIQEGYYMLQGTITAVEEDKSAFTLQADDGERYEIAMKEIGDADVEPEKDTHVAIACIGRENGERIMVVMLPEQEEWTINTVTGVTTANAMSSFTITTEDGRELSFRKNNCPVEDGALQNDSGDQVTVTYVESQGSNVPIEVTK